MIHSLEVREALVPKNILYRSKKGVGVPIDAWFQSGAVSLRTPHPAALDADFVAGRLAAHRDRESDKRQFLWAPFAVGRFADRTALEARGV